MTPADVRNCLIHALRVDLVGPALADEILDETPTRWYLTGFLAPLNASVDQRSDPTANDEPDLLEPASAAAEDNGEPPRASARSSPFPASLGLSVLVSADTSTLSVQLNWGDYRWVRLQPDSLQPEEVRLKPDPQPEEVRLKPDPPLEPEQWQRSPHHAAFTLNLPAMGNHPRQVQPVPTDPRLKLAYSVRLIPDRPDRARVVSVFLSNERGDALTAERRDEHYVFQPEITVTSPTPFLPQPNLRGRDDHDEWDERLADLHYRDVQDYAVGHGVATAADRDPDGHCRTVRTAWIPEAAVDFVAPSKIPAVELRMEILAALPDAATAQTALQPLLSAYRAWIQQQRARLPTFHAPQHDIGVELLNRAANAADRIEAGWAALADSLVWRAFQLTNKTMARAARQRRPGVAPEWRPFQLAFILLNLRGMVEPAHGDREIVDLLFFPTGGGKTEAYLGLAAFTLLLRRLRNPGLQSAGLTVLMRYTLRLLILDQLGRAATLICALELERAADPKTLGEWPFEIGLWVGQAATPNRMGSRNDDNEYTARSKTIAYKNGRSGSAPIPLENCPWCGKEFTPDSFQLVPHPDTPTDLRVICVNRDCDFAGHTGRTLPILSVDEPIYRRLPCFLIATVDKFAALPWTGETGALLGRVDRYDVNGFYGPCAPQRGQPLPGPQKRLPPPDLIIQDELHLIAGPLGTIAGLYEAALETLCRDERVNPPIRPKIIASTATVRRAEHQIRALFDRRDVDIFPPPGLDRRDSFFAKTHPPEHTHPRLYVGIAAQGRSLRGCRETLIT